MAIAFDSASSSGDTNGTSLTWSHTVGSGTDRILIVGINTQAGNTVSGVTFNGTSLTQRIANDGDASSLGFYGYEYIYYLLAPANTTANIVVSSSVSGWMRASAASYSGVDQTTPFDTSGSNNVVAATNSVSLTITASNCWVVSWYIADNSTSVHISPQSGITSRSENTDGIGDSAGTVATGASSLGWQTSQGSQRSTCLNVAIKPTASASSAVAVVPTLLTLGVG